MSVAKDTATSTVTKTATTKTATTKTATKIVLLHIGKTGGTSLRNVINSEYSPNFRNAQFELHPGRHVARIRDLPNAAYAFFVRCPVKRFISGFFSRYTRYLLKDPDITPKEIQIFQRFQTPEQLANALALGKSEHERSQAEAAMRQITHLHKDINYYVEGIEHLKSHIHKVVFVGTLEHINKDFNNLLARLGMPAVQVPHDHARPDTFKHLGELSERSIDTVKAHYHRDYEILNYLVDQYFLPATYLNEIT